ncbi:MULTISPECIES: NtaA/DmoA family FMN-dependent monooxygenase [Streptomyces]|uniref:NtaA/DmoA family FMN-dependent monooxygenase n=2 Tax=Streptomyces TaxID=1883 RepID=A0ABV9J8J1_9ACTN
MRDDKMVLVAFGQATVSQTQNGAWMHPGSDPNVLQPEYYINLGREVERAGFDMLFFDDRWAMPGTYGRSFRDAVRRGTRVVKLDLLTILGLISAHTERIGLGATYSTTYFHPFHVARAFATLDHLSKGRAVWNIVTSLNQDEAENFGTPFMEHDSRYDRADEFLEVVTGLWETWERDAFRLDRSTGVFADPDKVHYLDHKGAAFVSRGPLTVPQPPQGWPVLLQAGQSGRGRKFAARWADLIFVVAAGIESGQKVYREQHTAFEEVGRTAAPGRILPAVQVVVGPTEAIAREKKAYLDSLSDPEEALILLSELSGLDFSSYDLDEPLPADIVSRTTGSQAIVSSIIGKLRANYGESATTRDLGEMMGSQSGVHIIGNPQQVADELCAWFEGRACDGFVIQQADTPGSFEDFGRYVIPELRRRGVVDEPPTRGTFRDRLGLDARAGR